MHLPRTFLTQAVERPTGFSMNCMLVSVLLPALDSDVNVNWIQLNAASNSCCVLAGKQNCSASGERIEYN